MGQKMVNFSDLSGELITEADAVARIVIHEHPDLAGAPVEIEVLADEALAVEKAAVRIALVELHLPGEDEPRRVAMDVAAFDSLATDRAMSELLSSARAARRPVKSREKRGGARDNEPSAAKDPEPSAVKEPERPATGGPGPVRAVPVRAAPVRVAPAPAPPFATAASLAAAGLAEATAGGA